MTRKRAQLTDATAQATLDAGGILDRIGGDTTELDVREIPIAQIRPNPFQPRRHFDDQSVAELAASLRAHGFYGHLLVRRKGRSYQLAYGERRLRAAHLAGLTAIPVQVRDLSDQQMMEIALTENVLREDLHPVEEARGYLRLQQEMGYSIRQIAARIGKSSSYVGTLLSIVRYPDLEEAVRTADIPVRTAEELAKIEDPQTRRFFIEQVSAGHLDRDQLIAARQAGNATPSPQPQVRPVRTADSRPAGVAAMQRIYRSLQQPQLTQVEPQVKDEAIRLLRRIIEEAGRLLADLERKA